MAKAIWNGTIVAESGQCRIVENNHYFPPESIRREFFELSATHTECPWKCTASYYDIVVECKRNKDAAWFYPEPKPAAEEIHGHVAFWRGVAVEP